MPQFINPFPGMVPARKMNNEELVRALRQDLAAEQEATHLYTAHADATENPVAKKILLDIADEERIHAGEFLRLIEMFTGDEGHFLLQGATEADEKTERIRSPANTATGFNPLDPLGIFQPVIKDIKRVTAGPTRLVLGTKMKEIPMERRE